MNKLNRISKFLKEELQMIEFIETCYKQGLCTSEEAYDKTVEYLSSNKDTWFNLINTPEKENAYQMNNYN